MITDLDQARRDRDAVRLRYVVRSALRRLASTDQLFTPRGSRVVVLLAEAAIHLADGRIVEARDFAVRAGVWRAG